MPQLCRLCILGEHTAAMSWASILLECLGLSILLGCLGFSILLGCLGLSILLQYLGFSILLGCLGPSLLLGCLGLSILLEYLGPVYCWDILASAYRWDVHLFSLQMYWADSRMFWMLEVSVTTWTHHKAGCIGHPGVMDQQTILCWIHLILSKVLLLPVQWSPVRPLTSNSLLIVQAFYIIIQGWACEMYCKGRNIRGTKGCSFGRYRSISSEQKSCFSHVQIKAAFFWTADWRE